MKQHGRDEAERVAVAAGTNMAYFEQIACGARRPSVELADRLAEASGGRMETLSLLRAKNEIAQQRAERESATP